MPRIPNITLGSRRSIAAATLAMLVLWAPWFVALYPGGFNCWDTYYQITMCYPGEYTVWEIPWADSDSVTDATFSDHHPLFDTLLFGLFACTSDALFGSWNQGVFLFVALQGIATAFSFVVGIAYLEKVGVGASRGMRLCLWLFFALVPLYPVFAATMMKDSLFSWIYVWYFIAVIHLVRTKGESLANPKFLAALVVLSLLLALTKKPGLYVVIGVALLLCLAYRRQALRLLATALPAALVIWVVMPLFVFPALDVIPGGRQEALAVPFQQTARYVVEHGDELEDWEIEAIDAVLVYDTLEERYEADCADQVKFLWNSKATDDELLAYAQAYIHEGLRHPDTYFWAWFALVEGYFTPAESGLAVMNPTLSAEGSDKITHPQELDDFRDALCDWFDQLRETPVLSLLLHAVLYSLWLPLASLVIVVLRRREWLPVFAPVALSIVVICLTPQTEVRYALPLAYTAPLLFALALCVARPQPDSSPESDEAAGQ